MRFLFIALMLSLALGCENKDPDAYRQRHCGVGCAQHNGVAYTKSIYYNAMSSTLVCICHDGFTVPAR